MSGGYIDPQAPGDHQVIIFTIIGRWTQADADHWNQVVVDLKRRFPQLVGVTMTGKPTPRNLPRPTGGQTP
jgi:hypothetical protein